MREIKKNIFLETIPYENRHMSPRNLYIIRGEDRSLMVDTSNNTERDWNILKGRPMPLESIIKSWTFSLPMSIRTTQAWSQDYRHLVPGRS